MGEDEDAVLDKSEYNANVFEEKGYSALESSYEIP
jgi:hypothetical protein